MQTQPTDNFTVPLNQLVNCVCETASVDDMQRVVSLVENFKIKDMKMMIKATQVQKQANAASLSQIYIED